MRAIVVYKSKYGSTKAYAEWIAEELGCDVVDAKNVKVDDLIHYDTIVYGGGLYAEVINGVILITKNFDKLSGKKIAVYTTGITPLDCRDYYDKMVIEKNFKDANVSDIAAKMYMNEDYLNRIFKEKTRLTPSEFSKEYKIFEI